MSVKSCREAKLAKQLGVEVKCSECDGDGRVMVFGNLFALLPGARGKQLKFTRKRCRHCGGRGYVAPQAEERA